MPPPCSIYAPCARLHASRFDIAHPSNPAGTATVTSRTSSRAPTLLSGPATSSPSRHLFVRHPAAGHRFGSPPTRRNHRAPHFPHLNSTLSTFWITSPPKSIQFLDQRQPFFSFLFRFYGDDPLPSPAATPGPHPCASRAGQKRVRQALFDAHGVRYGIAASRSDAKRRSSRSKC